MSTEWMKQGSGSQQATPGGDAAQGGKQKAKDALRELDYEEQQAALAPPAARSTLRVGSKGEEVSELQRLLNIKSGAGLVPDGSFGPKTQAAVIAYQNKHSLNPDGVVGPKTWASLDQAPASQGGQEGGGQQPGGQQGQQGGGQQPGGQQGGGQQGQQGGQQGQQGGAQQGGGGPDAGGGWTPPTGGPYPLEAVDERVVKDPAGRYPGNPPPPTGWKYWPTGKAIKPAHKKLAEAATRKTAGTFTQDVLDGELFAARTEWHNYTVLWDKETGKPYNKPGLYRGGSLMVPKDPQGMAPSGPQGQAGQQQGQSGQQGQAGPQQGQTGQQQGQSGQQGQAGPQQGQTGPQQGQGGQSGQGGQQAGGGGGSIQRPNGYQQILQVFGQPGTDLTVIKIPCGPQGAERSVCCHKKIADALRGAFEDIVNAGLAEHLHSFDGCYNDRKKVGGTQPSTHSWGIAIDVNCATNPFRPKDTPSASESQKIIAPFFENRGFYWGIHFGDPMHFQYCTGY